ncbi:MAG: NAD(P)-dependent oxidoreductase [Betaproteobacteria bacterium]|nr:NAD(P)-dependent oxidoreductase [Betaproteobacteria bacterium]
MKIGIAGMGRMGSAMAARLLKLDHEVMVWNRTAEKTRPLAAAGAGVAASPKALAEACDLVITMLSDASAVDGTYSGSGGLLTGAVKGRLFVEMSTLPPVVQRGLAARAQAKSTSFIDCPVGGSVAQARDGKLLGFVGGEAADVARARPVLEQLCRRLEHVGPAGAGASMKLAINLPLLVYWQVLAEALSLVKPLGLDPARVMDIFADTSGGANVIKWRGGVLAEALRGKAPDSVSFDIELARKDLRTMVEEARYLGYSTPVTTQALDCYDQAVKRGLGPEDTALLVAQWVKDGRY